MEIAIIAAALLLAFSNGANDNFKGFASVWGSASLSYRKALTLASIATLAGALAALWLAHGLVQSFSGKGLVPAATLAQPSFMLAVAAGAATTVLLATRLGFPISTTHALLGGLVGAGLGLAGHINWAPLGSYFVLPLLLSPIAASLIAAILHRASRRWAKAEACLCLTPALAPATHPNTTSLARAALAPNLTNSTQWQLGSTSGSCAALEPRLRLSITALSDHTHLVSAMAICFARSLNDTPKLAAILLASHSLSHNGAIIAIALCMLIGGLLYSRRVAHTLSQQLSSLNTHTGLCANLTTASLVLLASHAALPVSTTHVTVGAIAGVGASSGGLQLPALRNILLSWCATLPLAASLAYLISQLT
jgi:inorganic phosphate transporter, PiT family